MPGILPMKVIKIGTSAQTRIAQACDRCRSKKIRCDGFRPSCTQCTSVGFECKTSDKLSRRAFPRGYTESLEERVRVLESEVKEFKDLLDSKDEKIDMLSRVHSQSPRQSSSSRRPSSIHSNRSGQCSELNNLRLEVPNLPDTFKVRQSPQLVNGASGESFFVGTSSGHALADAFKLKVQQSGRRCPDFKSECFFPSEPQRSSSYKAVDLPPAAPPRLVSDQMVNIFFQEWAPLFPVLHRPTFLSLYEQYVTYPESIKDKRSIILLHLVFGIATLSSEPRIAHEVDVCDKICYSALETFSKEPSLETLQLLILAQIFLIQRGDHARVLHYKSLSVGMSYRLGLHQSQKRFTLNILCGETRKKVFWSLYAIDCFSTTFLGLPRLLRDDDIECENPVDVDDEYVTENGFQPTLPGESTKLSSALALFSACRLLSRVLEQNYPASTTHELSLQRIAKLSDDLDEWFEDLPPHLKMAFAQEKPSTHTVSSRCPLLSLTYHYIRTLIHRPAVCANLGDLAQGSVVAVASSSKHMIQILLLLEERNLSFSHCLNKNELLVTCGFGLLFQNCDLDDGSKLRADCQKYIGAAISLLERNSASCATKFKLLACALNAARNSPAHDDSSPSQSAGSPIRPTHDLSERQKKIHDLAARYTLASTPKHTKNDLRNVPTLASMPSPANDITTRFRPPIIRSEKGSKRRTSTTTTTTTSTNLSSPTLSVPRSSRPSATPAATRNLNLDYFSFDNDPPMKQTTKAGTNVPDWEDIMTSMNEKTVMDNQNETVEDVYGWPAMDDLLHPPSMGGRSGPPSIHQKDKVWSPDVWSVSDELYSPRTNSQQKTQSLLSYSEDGLTSGEDFSSLGFGDASENALEALVLSDSDADLTLTPGG